MRGAAHSQQCKSVDSAASGSSKSGSDGGRVGGYAGDGGASGETAAACEEISGAKYLGVEVVCGAAAAEAATAGDDSTVSKKNGGGVVVAGNGLRGHLGESVGRRIKKFRGVLRGVVAEGIGGLLAASDKDGTVGEDNTVREGARESHAGNGGYCGGCVWCTDCDDVSVGRSGAVLVTRRSASC